MINIPKTLIKAISEGNQPLSDLEQYLLSNYTIGDILKAFAELIITTEDVVNRPPISVSQEEYNTIMSLFKIRGLRTIDGMVIEETRGRKRIVKG